MTNLDTEFELLSQISGAISRDYHPTEDDPWEGSPFQWILSQPSRAKGAIGEKIIASWVESHGGDVQRSGDSQADRLINGTRVEIKLSTLWRDNGIYKFQQVRNQEYEHLIALGLSPQEVHCWVIAKAQLLDHVIGKTGQHTGSGGADTAWITLTPSDPPSWMRACGGTLDQAWEIINGWSEQ